MKKYILLLTVVLLLLPLSLCVVATDTPNVSVAAVTCKPGETVELPVVLSDCNGFTNLAIEIEYDKAALELVNVENFVTKATFVPSEYLNDEPYVLSWFAVSDVKHEGALVNLHFKILDNAKKGQHVVSINYYKGKKGTNVDGYHVNYDKDFNSLGLTYTNGSVTVEGQNESVLPEGIYVAVENAAAKIGEIIEVPVQLYNSNGFTNISLEFGYDSSALQFLGAEIGEVNALMTEAQDYTVNPYNISWDAVSNIDFNGILATLKFVVLENAQYKKYPITVDYYKGRNGLNVDGYHVNYDQNFDCLGLQYVNGGVLVKPNDYILTVEKQNVDNGISLDIAAYAPDELKGNVYIALYEGKRMSKSLIRKASESINVEESNIYTKAKIMWIDDADGFSPLCDGVEITFVKEEQ